jgi:hypothetical protein
MLICFCFHMVADVSMVSLANWNKGFLFRDEISIVMKLSYELVELCRRPPHLMCQHVVYMADFINSWTWLSSWCHILILLATTVNLALISVLSAHLMASLVQLVTKFEMQRVDHWLASCLFEMTACLQMLGWMFLSFWNTFQSLDCAGLCLKVRVNSRFYSFWSVDAFDL